MLNVRIWTWHKHTMLSLVIQEDMKKNIYFYLRFRNIMKHLSCNKLQSFSAWTLWRIFFGFVKHKWIKTIIDQYTFFRVSLNLRKWGKCYIFEWIIYSDLGSLVANKTGYLSCALNILRCKVIPKKAFLKVLYIRFYL